jgi:tetratricopeptide (TPR) repeat protein
MPEKFKNQVEMDSAVGFYDSGVAHADKGEWVQAIGDFTKVIQLNPSVPEAYFNRAVAYTKIGNLSQALADFNEILRLKPNDAVVLHNRAVVRFQLKDLEGAREDIDQVRRLEGKVNPEFVQMLSEAMGK